MGGYEEFFEEIHPEGNSTGGLSIIHPDHLKEILETLFPAIQHWWTMKALRKDGPPTGDLNKIWELLSVKMERISLEKFNFPERAISTILKTEEKSMEDFLQLENDSLLGIYQVGRKSIGQINEVLKTYGLKTGMTKQEIEEVSS